MSRIKLAQNIVRSVDQDPALKAISDGIHGFCVRMNIETLAEGTETDAQVDVLKTLGDSLCKSYSFGRPMSLERLYGWLKPRGDIASERPAENALDEHLKSIGRGCLKLPKFACIIVCPDRLPYERSQKNRAHTCDLRQCSSSSLKRKTRGKENFSIKTFRHETMGVSGTFRSEARRTAIFWFSRLQLPSNGR